MSYKIVKANEAAFYQAPGHYDMRATRLHNPGNVENGRLILGLSHFLPGGGCEMSANPLECIYYVIDGEIDVDLEGEKTTLHAGDSIHLGPFTKKGLHNNGAATTRMLVVLLPPQQG